MQGAHTNAGWPRPPRPLRGTPSPLECQLSPLHFTLTGLMLGITNIDSTASSQSEVHHRAPTSATRGMFAGTAEATRQREFRRPQP